MTRRFTQNTNLFSELRKAAVFNPVAIIALPLSILFYIIGLSLNKAILDDIGSYISKRLAIFTTIKGFFWGGLILSIVLCIMFGIFISKKDYARATNCGAAMCGYSGAECLFFMFNSVLSDYSDIANLKSFFIIFFVLFFIVLVGEIAFPVLIKKQMDIVVDNLEKCYLELTKSKINGISFTNANTINNGSYFEITYDDIRNVRTSQPNVQTKQYFNLYIDTKYGTYSLSIDNHITAHDFIKKALIDTRSGMEISFPEIKNSTSSAQIKDGHGKIQNYNSDVEWCCPTCARINQNYVGTCGCGTRKP